MKLKIMYRRIICIIVFLLAIMLLGESIIVFAKEDEYLPSGISYDDIGEKIEEYVRENESTTVGMAVSVFDDESDIYKNYFGYANKENGLEITEDTVFEWGSVTKLLVWISVMQLYEQGKIDLNQDIKTYLPKGFLTNLEYDTPVTMLNLMNHTAGFQELYTDIYVKDKNAIQSLGDALYAHEPAQIYEPGTVSAYSNWGAALAGYIVEQISGMEFYEYVHLNIFEPLGMEHSGLAADLSDNEWVREQRKSLECYTTEGKLIKDCFYYITLYPTGMCMSTLNDLSMFVKALLSEDAALLNKEETWELLFSPTIYYGNSDVPSNCHGFWVLPFRNLTYGHGGQSEGSSSYVLIDRTAKVGVALMTNQSHENIYNRKMMPMIFGDFVADKYFENRIKPSGIYRSARVVRKGPLKISSLSYVTLSGDDDEVWANGSNGRICYSGEDYLKSSMIEFVKEMGLVILWVIVVIFSVISIIIRIIRRLIMKIKHKEKTETVLGRWSIISALLQLITVILLGIMLISASNYELSSSYEWISAILGIMALVMMFLVVYGLCRLLKEKVSRKRKVYNVFVMICMIVTVINILYWNLFMFWKI